MSVIKGKKLQLGYDGTASNNFTLYQPGTPDGTLRLANGIAGAETDVMTLASNGNVSIGTTTVSGYATGKLALYNSSDNFISVHSGAANASGINFVNSVTSSAVGLLRYQQSNNVMDFFTNGTQRMAIDSSGRVTMPYQPAFAVTDLTFPSGTAGQGTGGTIVSNVGSCYNSSNGRFTAPVSGTYLFGLSVQAFNSGSTTYINVALGVNGSSTVGSFVSGYGGVHNNHMQITGSVIKYLNANDYAQIHVDYGARSGAQSIFNGFLIG